MNLLDALDVLGAPIHQQLHLLPAGYLITVVNQAYHRSVICIFNCGVCVVPGDTPCIA